jgi:hypothetical protein
MMTSVSAAIIREVQRVFQRFLFSGSGVKFKREVHKPHPLMPNVWATHKTYSAPSREAAVAFLRTQKITEPYVYVEVVTPAGIFGIDRMGEIYDSGGELPGDSASLL